MKNEENSRGKASRWPECRWPPSEFDVGSRSCSHREPLWETAKGEATEIKKEEKMKNEEDSRGKSITVTGMLLATVRIWRR